MTETARLAHYVLPASSQYEKTEFTLFNFEFPINYFQVRDAWRRRSKAPCRSRKSICGWRARSGFAGQRCACASARGGLSVPQRIREGAAHVHRPRIRKPPRSASLILYDTLGPTLPDGTAAAAPTLAGRATLCEAQYASGRAARARSRGEEDRRCSRLAMRFSTRSSRHAQRRRDHRVMITSEVWSLVGASRPQDPTCDTRDAGLARPVSSRSQPPQKRSDYPFVLAAGQRRMFNAIQIFRDPAWRSDDPDGALLINTSDLDALGVSDGEWIAWCVHRPGGWSSAARRMTAYARANWRCRMASARTIPVDGGERLVKWPAHQHPDRWPQIVIPSQGSSYHKNVAVRLSLAPAHEAAASQMQSERIHARAAAG